MTIVEPHFRQVAKISIDVVGPSAGNGGSPSCSEVVAVMFKFSAEETYRELGPSCFCPEQDEENDYDGDDIDDSLKLLEEDIGPTVEQYHGVSKELFSTTPPSERNQILSDQISQVVEAAVDSVRNGVTDRRVKVETLEFLWGEMEGWINANIDSLQNNLIDKVDVKIELLSRLITDEIGYDDDDGEALARYFVAEGVDDDELHNYQDYVGGEEEEDRGWFRFAPGDGTDRSSIEAALRPKQMLDAGDNCCSICMNDEVNDMVQMPCSHVFHNGCIVQWLEQKNACPVCRFQITNDGPNGV